MTEQNKLDTEDARRRAKICNILNTHYSCVCGNSPPYCEVVVALLKVIS